eukprot:8806491-Pyramimonas_sp.AAC.3
MGPFSGLQQTVKGTYTDVCCTKRVYQVQTCRVSNAAGHCLSNTSYIPTSCVLHPPVFYILTLRPSRAVATHELRRGRGVALAAEDTTQSSGAEVHIPACVLPHTVVDVTGKAPKQLEVQCLDR